jgi:hypothetical protein
VSATDAVFRLVGDTHAPPSPRHALILAVWKGENATGAPDYYTVGYANIDAKFSTVGAAMEKAIETLQFTDALSPGVVVIPIGVAS